MIPTIQALPKTVTIAWEREDVTSIFDRWRQYVYTGLGELSCSVDPSRSGELLSLAHEHKWVIIEGNLDTLPVPLIFKFYGTPVKVKHFSNGRCGEFLECAFQVLHPNSPMPPDLRIQLGLPPYPELPMQPIIDEYDMLIDDDNEIETESESEPELPVWSFAFDRVNRESPQAREPKGDRPRDRSGYQDRE